jgi:hypothetical protein
LVEFEDPWGSCLTGGSGACRGTKDNPVTTYAPTMNQREYLTTALVGRSQAAIAYSYVEERKGAPVYVPTARTVTTSFEVSEGVPAVDTPGCTGCLQALSNGWIHSSGVWTSAIGIPYILATWTAGDPHYQRATQAINITANVELGFARAMQISGGKDGAGPLASEIAAPLVHGGFPDQAVIVYDYSASNFYPGMKSATWDIERNSVRAFRTLKEGSVTPTPGSFESGRWADFIDALVLIPGSSLGFAGGTVPTQSVNASDGATFWTKVAR